MSVILTCRKVHEKSSACLQRVANGRTPLLPTLYSVNMCDVNNSKYDILQSSRLHSIRLNHDQTCLSFVQPSHCVVLLRAKPTDTP